MYCRNCGKQIEDNANYCPHCGQFQKEPIQPKEMTWETCEIICREIVKSAGTFFGGGIVRFSVEAIGPKGRYIAGHSVGIQVNRNQYLLGTQFIPPQFIPHSTDKDVVDALDALIRDLTKDGWQPVGRGQSWFSHQFKRVAK